jgi:hypothetical protein
MHRTPFDEPSYCPVCGRSADASPAAGGCICPECPVCSCVGDPTCYSAGHLALSPEQEASRLAIEALSDMGLEGLDFLSNDQ